MIAKDARECHDRRSKRRIRARSEATWSLNAVFDEESGRFLCSAALEDVI